jgi:hypothetical protein
MWNSPRDRGDALKRWRRTEIQIERHETLLIRTGDPGGSRCTLCGRGSLVSVDDAAAVLQLTPEALRSWLAAKLPPGETPRLVCASCLYEAIRS